MASQEADRSHGAPRPPPAIAVLLVDDQRFVGLALGRLLATEQDIAIHCCSRPTEALALANEIHPAVILQDLVMPDIDGLTMVRMFRANPPTADTPIIVLSGNDDAGTRRRALAGDANDYLVKLPAREDLVACIRRHARATAHATPGASTTAPPTVSSEPLADETLDRSVIASFKPAGTAGFPDFVLSLIDLFIHEAASQVEALRDAGQRMDAGALKATAHSLKGSSMTIGATRLAALCTQMETSADERDARVTSDLMTQFDRELVKVRSALIAERQGSGQP